MDQHRRGIPEKVTCSIHCEDIRSAVFEAATRQSITAVAGHPFKFAPDGTLATKVSDSALAV